MTRRFQPIVRNPHVLTIAGNFWPRAIDEQRFPAARRCHQISDSVSIVSFEHRPSGQARGELVLLHGLEGSADAGYLLSLAQAALTRGFAVHRVNMRSCGGTEHLSDTLYHSGLTSDTYDMLRRLRAETSRPIFVAGFSLGGNVALKLAGELGETDLVSGVCAVSTPIDLAICARRLEAFSNRLYARRFLDRLRKRVTGKSVLAPDQYDVRGIERIRTIWEFDDRFTAPLFGFGTAENYYRTQSAAAYLDAIRTPTLVIAAQDDPLVPVAVYSHPAFRSNPALRLLLTEHGGHLGFLSKRKPRFWVDEVVLDWFESLIGSRANPGTGAPVAAYSR